MRTVHEFFTNARMEDSQFEYSWFHSWMVVFAQGESLRGMTSATAPLWNINLRRSTPDQGVLLNGCEVELSCSSHAVSKRRTVSIQSVCRHLGKRQIIAFEGVFQQFQTNFRLRFENQIFWYATSLPLLGVFFFKPLFWHEQLTFNQATLGIISLRGTLAKRGLLRKVRSQRHNYRFVHAIIGSTLFERRYAASFKPKRGQKRDAGRLGLIQSV